MSYAADNFSGGVERVLNRYYGVAVATSDAPYVVVFGSLGFVWDGSTLFVRVVAPYKRGAGHGVRPS